MCASAHASIFFLSFVTNVVVITLSFNIEWRRASICVVLFEPIFL